jgi:hypothetical protein
MYPRASLEKAVLKTIDKKGGAAEAHTVTFPFNPTDIEVTRGCGFSSENSDSNSVNDYGGLKFGGAKSDELSMSFILDTSEPSISDPKYALFMMNPIIASTPATQPASLAKMIPFFAGAVNADSVTETLDTITEMTKLSKADRKAKKSDAAAVIYPRLVEFTWGDQIKFSGAIEKFSFKILLFDSDGTPKRAEVSLGLVGVYGELVGNPEDMLFGQGESKATSTTSL